MGVDSTKGSTPPPRDAPTGRGSLIYAVGIALALLGVLAVALYGISSERKPAPAPVPESAPARVELHPQPPRVQPSDVSVELRARLGSLSEQLDALTQHADALRTRVETLERELARRPAATPARAAAPAASATPAVPTDLDPLYERLSTIETSLEREGTERLKSQEDLLARVYKLESSREDGTATQAKVQEAAEERVFKLEERVHAAEAQVVEIEKRISKRIEKLEAH